CSAPEVLRLCHPLATHPIPGKTTAQTSIKVPLSLNSVQYSPQPVPLRAQSALKKAPLETVAQSLHIVACLRQVYGPIHPFLPPQIDACSALHTIGTDQTPVAGPLVGGPMFYASLVRCGGKQLPRSVPTVSP